LSMLPFTALSSEDVIASTGIVQGNGPARTLFCPCFHLEMTIYMNIKPIRL
jgi:tryptophan synthase beta subunit